MQSYHWVFQHRWKMVYPKRARQLVVYSGGGSCALETSLFLICAFYQHLSSQHCRALSVPRLVISSRQAAIADVRGAPKQPRRHTLDESQLPFFFLLLLWHPPGFFFFHLCVWTLLLRQRRMTTSCFLGLFISDWLYHVINSDICWSVKDSVKAQLSWCLLLPPTL